MISGLIIQNDTAEEAPALTDGDSTDDKIVELWLHGKSGHTERSYRRTVDEFRAFVRKPLRSVQLSDLQVYADSLTGAQSSRSLRTNTVKSLLAFAQRIGATPVNVGGALKGKKQPQTLSARILTEGEVAKMLALTTGRDHALIRLCYGGGFRVSEVVALRWADIVDAKDDGAYATVTGKGDKVRTVRLSVETAKVLRELRGDASEMAYVFAGRDGKPIAAVSAWRHVSKAAKAAGIGRAVSPHFLRHSHASHSLERGASLVLVRDTLGHASVATTDRYLHARPGESSSRYLPV
jgi:integrase/recombinase XerD